MALTHQDKLLIRRMIDDRLPRDRRVNIDDNHLHNWLQNKRVTQDIPNEAAQLNWLEFKDATDQWELSSPLGGVTGADWRWDYAIHAGYTGTEGEEVTESLGFTYKKFSTIALAVADANTNRQTAGQATTFAIYPGTYTHSSTVNISPPTSGAYHFVGVGEGVIVQPSGNSVNPFTLLLAGATDPLVTFQDITVTDNGRTSVTLFVGAQGMQGIWRRCRFLLSAAANIGIEMETDTRGYNIQDCVFSGDGDGIGINATTEAWLFLRRCRFLSLTSGMTLTNFTNFDITGNYFSGCTTSIVAAGGTSWEQGGIAGNTFVVGTTGISFPAGSILVFSLSIHDNLFVDIGASQFGIDFNAMNGSGAASGNAIVGNTFLASNTAGIGIRGDTATSSTLNNIASHNIFKGFASGNEITQWTAAGNEAYHNMSVDAAGLTKQALADIGNPVGHASGGGSAAPNDIDYLVGTADSDLTNEIVVGTAPGGELGGTWGSPTVDPTHAGSAHHAQAHGSAQHTENGNHKVFYADGSGDQQELALGADGTVLASAGTGSAPVMEAIYTTHIAVFHPITEELESGALWPTQGICVGESGEHGPFTAIRAKAVCGTAGSGTNTIVIEADDNPAFSSATTLFTLALNTSTEVDDATLDASWASGDIFVRARCTAVDATGPEEVVVSFYFKEQAVNF